MHLACAWNRPRWPSRRSAIDVFVAVAVDGTWRKSGSQQLDQLSLKRRTKTKSKTRCA